MTLPARFGPFLLVEELGRGSMGEVFLARPSSPGYGLPWPLVIKRLHGFLADEEFTRRFRHEALVASRIDSPHVAKVLEAGEVGEELYIAIELVPGWPLSAVLRELRAAGRHFSIPSALDLAIGVLRGLEAIHEATDEAGQRLGALHRDLAPKNVMVGDDGLVRLIDLGIGKSRLQDWKTATGAVIGTPGFMSPEQTLGRPTDVRSDLYSAGAVLFELLTLEPYVAVQGIRPMLLECANPRVRPPSSARSELPQVLDLITLRALAVDPGERFASAAAFREALENALSELDTMGGREPLEALLGELAFTELKTAVSEARSRVAAKSSDEWLESAGGAESTMVVTTLARRPELTFGGETGVTEPQFAGLLDPAERSAPVSPSHEVRRRLVAVALIAALVLLAFQAGRSLKGASNPEDGGLRANEPGAVALPNRGVEDGAGPASAAQVALEPSEAKPVASRPTGAEPTSAMPTGAMPSGGQPTPSKPSTANHSAAKSSAAKSSAAKSSAAKSSPAKSSPAKSSPAKSSAEKSSAEKNSAATPAGLQEPVRAESSEPRPFEALSPASRLKQRLEATDPADVTALQRLADEGARLVSTNPGAGKARSCFVNAKLNPRPKKRLLECAALAAQL
ncbi:MAG: protein kinase [Deltaproteobacteria bacterium]|nr:protein kinase [Deltaproteobacteria bacterium]